MSEPIYFDPNEPKWRAALRSLIMRKLRINGPQTTRELATACAVSLEALSPRMSEMHWVGDIYDTGNRRRSASGRGRPLKVWCVNPSR